MSDTAQFDRLSVVSHQTTPPRDSVRPTSDLAPAGGITFGLLVGGAVYATLGVIFFIFNGGHL